MQGPSFQNVLPCGRSWPGGFFWSQYLAKYRPRRQGCSRSNLLQSPGNAGSGFLRLSCKGTNMRKLLFFLEFTFGEFHYVPEVVMINPYFQRVTPKLSVSHFGFIKNYYKKYGLCHLATSKWKTRWDCRSYRIDGVRYLPA